MTQKIYTPSEFLNELNKNLRDLVDYHLPRTKQGKQTQREIAKAQSHIRKAVAFLNDGGAE